jgi:hypothetical protein
MWARSVWMSSPGENPRSSTPFENGVVLLRYEIKQSANIGTLDFSWTASDRARPLFHAAADYHWPWA